jgi:hypothetical protein
MQQVLAICLVNYIYKFTMAVVLTPLIYFVENRIEKYLGHETTSKMKRAAMGYEGEDAGIIVPAQPPEL